MAKGEFNQKVSQGINLGVKDAQNVAGITLSKLNIFGIDKMGETAGFLIYILGMLAFLGYAASMVSGAATGLVNRRPLPVNSNWTLRVGHAIGSTAGTVGTYTLQGVATSAEQISGYQSVNSPLNPFDNRYPVYRNSDAYQPPVTPYTTLPSGGQANTTYQYGVPPQSPQY